MAGVVGNTDTHMDIVGVDTCMVVVATHSAEVSGCTTNILFNCRKSRQNHLLVVLNYLNHSRLCLPIREQ